MGRYYTAEVCLNGHYSTGSVETDLERRAPFCDRCGEKTITKCSACGTGIRGHYDESLLPYNPPKYCFSCGKPFPWTANALKAAEELINLSDLDNEEKTGLIADLPSLVVDGPRTKLVAVKIQSFIKKAGPILGSALRDIIVDIGSSTICKSIGL
ncbi:MAG: DUF2321 domain-containing protein [Bacteroidales bacterium]|nr:DUF2321 domain-containing protein [Bacteroidales bacterium]